MRPRGKSLNSETGKAAADKRFKDAKDISPGLDGWAMASVTQRAAWWYRLCKGCERGDRRALRKFYLLSRAGYTPDFDLTDPIERMLGKWRAKYGK